jgi:hypothetical protein
MLWPLAPEGRQQQKPEVSIAQAQELVNANRPKELDPVKVSELITFPHADDGGLGLVEEVRFLFLPQVVVRGDVFKQGRYVGSKRTRIHDGEVWPLDGWSRPYLSFQGAQPIDDSESARLLRALDAFAANVLEVDRGPARWSRYLPPEVRDFTLVRDLGMPEKSTNVALLTAVAEFLDSRVWMLWLALERPQDFLSLLDDVERRNPDSLTALLAFYRPHQKQAVSALAGLPRDHRQRDSRFLEGVLVGSRWKAQNGEIGEPLVARLPESQRLYWVQFGPSTLLLFEWSGDSLRLANIVLLSN